MDIAIVGLGCRFPGARDPLGFWELIRSGTVVFRPIPPSRWDHGAFHDPSTRIPDKAYIDRGARDAGGAATDPSADQAGETRTDDNREPPVAS